MEFACVILGVIFLISGILFGNGKTHRYLSLWKNISQEEKEKIDILPLCRNIGNMIALAGVIFMLRGVFPDVMERWFVIIMVIWMLMAGFDVWYIEKSNRYYKK